MKIVFWSHLRHSGGVTTNLACMAAMSAIAGSGKSVLLENHYNANSLGSVLLPQEKHEQLREQKHYCNQCGMEYLLKKLYTGETSESLIHRASVPLLYSSIFYIPQSYIFNREIFEYEFELVRKRLFQCLESFSEFVFVDTEASGNLSSAAILEEADLIVVNLNQNLSSWKDFFGRYSALLNKAIFLIGKYRAEQEWTLVRLRREFHIRAENIGVVPYNVELEGAAMEGRLLQFVNRNYYRAENIGKR